ncbi:unnamed protein product [Prorocentrum cordatum]|uniref:Uncharacterized protein n=1 Tax=Prorocentrum cordatum TaxID=2364126 RepID=A0ABN9TI15_9DINO|nr:unnamed protein product [Polarella glacialis]
MPGGLPARLECPARSRPRQAARAAWAARAARVEAARRPAAPRCASQPGGGSRRSEPGHPDAVALASAREPTAREPAAEECWHAAAGGRGAAASGSREASPRGRSTRETEEGGAAPPGAGGAAAAPPTGAEGGGWSAEAEESAERRSRLEALAQQVKRDLEGQRQPPGGGARHFAPGRRRGSAGSGCAGERLYQDAARRQLRRQCLQAQQEEERLAGEQQEATFHPAISASQRRCPGVSRSRLDPSGSGTRSKLESMRKARDESEVSGCTFRPEVDHRSEELMAQRIQRMKVTGTLYDSLYEDAMRRKERLSDAHAALPPGVTFHPEICQGRRRGEAEEVHFWSRLAYSKDSSEKLQLSRQKQQEDQDKRDPSPDFRPKTGRAPLVPRNKDHLPIGDFLYESGRERAAQSTASAQRADAAADARRLSPKAGGNSQQLLEQSKRLRYRELYEALARNDPEGKLRAETATLDGLDVELEGLLRPLVAYLRKKATVTEFEQFCTDLDYAKHSAAPSAHLFVARRSSGQSSGRGRQESPPRAQHAGRRGPASARGAGEPLHERLLRDAAARESWLLEQRALKEEHELEECTFRPNTRASLCAGKAGRSQSARALAPATPRRPVPPGHLTERSPSDTPRTPRTPRTPGRSMLPTALIEHFATISAGEKTMAIPNSAEYHADTGGSAGGARRRALPGPNVHSQCHLILVRTSNPDSA